MSDPTVIATISIMRQIGQDDFQQNRFSREFSTTLPLSNILSWAENMGISAPASINDIVFFDHTGSST